MSPILERIYGLMAERRMNAKYVSETLHLSNSSFTDWKKGKGNPNVEALTKMAEFFGVSLDYLILGKEPSPALPSHLPDDLDFSSQLDRDLYDKFHRLPAEFQGKVMAYLDGMLAVLPAPAQSAENTACKPRSDVDRPRIGTLSRMRNPLLRRCSLRLRTFCRSKGQRNLPENQAPVLEGIHRKDAFASKGLKICISAMNGSRSEAAESL